MRESLPETPSQSKWLVDNLETGSVVGVDPFIFSNSLWTAMEQELEVGGLKLVTYFLQLVLNFCRSKYGFSQDNIISF
jgi:hypothetical protein